MVKFGSILLIILSFIFTVFFACNEDAYITDSSAKLSFSTDTVLFDTVFTKMGTVTKYFMVYNNNNKSVNISSIRLADDTWNYRLNINGKPANSVKDIEIRGKDSIYIFVEVTVNPTNQSSPFVIHDSIIFQTNGNFQDVDLVAWGQNAYILNNSVLETQTLKTDKPYLVFNGLFIDSSQVLTIKPGTTIYFHKKARMYIFGTLLSEGLIDKPVVFRGDRLDRMLSNVPYDKIPGQWEGIIFFPSSKNNKLVNTKIRNAVIGIQAGIIPYAGSPQIELQNCYINNHSYAGIFAINAEIKAYNSVIANCGGYAIACVSGGDYNFYQCTIANYYNHANRSEPSVVLTNFVEYENIRYPGDLKNAVFGNCIIYGGNQNEIGFGIMDGYKLNYKFENCLIKWEDAIDGIDRNDKTKFLNNLYSKEPAFDSIGDYDYNFRLDTLSPAKDAGSINIVNRLLYLLEYDLDNKSRLKDKAPDIGAYERQE
jgi:hypothetical protein